LNRSVYGNGLNSLGAAASGVSFRKAATALVCVLMVSGFAQARAHRSQAWAETQFNKAEAQRQTLNGRAEQARTKREYQTVIASYRRIVLEAPSSSKAEGSAFLVAQLTAEMGRHFKDDSALYSAVRGYKFLRREYPGSKHRVEALLAIGEIYKNDLGLESDANAAFEELIRLYPHNELVKEAKAELLADSPKDAGDSEATDAGDAPDKSSGRRDKSERASKQPETKPEPEVRESETGSPEKPVGVTDVQYWSTAEYTRIAVKLDQSVQFESQRIDNPERIYFDLKNAKLASHLMGQSFDVEDGVVKKVRVAQYKPGRARVVIETDDRASYNASVVLNPPRLVIDIHGEENHRSGPTASGAIKAKAAKASAEETAGGNDADAEQTETQAGTDVVVAKSKVPDQPNSSMSAASTLKSTANVPKKVIVEADDDDDGSADSSDTTATASSAKAVKRTNTASAGNRTRRQRSAASRGMREAQPTSGGDRSLIRTLGLKIGKIVIDPGHGGHDTGTIGPNGLLEKDLVLDVGKRLGKLLESRLGADVVFTRSDDTFIPLESRTSIANQEQADLFVSVHANSSRDPDARGVETYYLNFTSSPEALEVAARENAASDKSIHELQDLVKKIALKEKVEESHEFASDVQQSLHAALSAKSSGVRDRGVKKAPFVVLIGANMPSILAEISFLSNPGDERRLKTPDYRQRIAESLYRGISRYVNGLGGVKVASRIEKASAN
jgi:N-acetylmuramoyl-L-alanine amidase